MSTKIRSWHVSRIDRSYPNISENPEIEVIDVQSRKTRIGKVEAVTREEATAKAHELHPGIEIEITRDE